MKISDGYLVYRNETDTPQWVEEFPSESLKDFRILNPDTRASIRESLNPIYKLVPSSLDDRAAIDMIAKNPVQSEEMRRD